MTRTRPLVAVLSLALVPALLAQVGFQEQPGFGGLMGQSNPGVTRADNATDFFQRLGQSATGQTGGLNPIGQGRSSWNQGYSTGSNTLVTPVAHGRTYPFDPSARAVAIGGAGGYSLQGQTVRSSGSGTLFGYDASSGTVSVRHQTPAGNVYLLAYTAVELSATLRASIGRELSPGEALGTVRGDYLFLQALVYQQNQWIPSERAFNVPGVPYPAGVAAGTATVDF